MRPRRLHILHVVYAFSVGGLENVIVQLINHLPHDRFRHTVLALTTISDFKERVNIPDVAFVALDKPPGHAVPLYPRILRLLRELKPDVMHTCNLAALELVPLGWLARVPRRVHAEHGWDAHDLNGRNPRYQRVRRLYRPFVHQYVAVSEELQHYLHQAVGVAPRRVRLVANGVDTERFATRQPDRRPPEDFPFDPQQHVVFGTVGRMQTVKNQPLLARAFVRLVQTQAEWAPRARLALVGDGPLMAEVRETLCRAGLESLAWLPGARADVDRILPWLDCFVLPSTTEGTSCTLQEALACGLPAIVTAVGGNPKLVQADVHGWLVPSEDESALVEAMSAVLRQPSRARDMGNAARAHAVQRFGLPAMLQQYEELFSGAS